jgi:hypothetical protein
MVQAVQGRCGQKHRRRCESNWRRPWPLTKPEEPLDVLRQRHLRHDRPDVVLHAARTVELLGERARPLLPTMRETLEQAKTTEQRGDMPMFIRFSLEAALEEGLRAANPLRPRCAADNQDGLPPRRHAVDVDPAAAGRRQDAPGKWFLRS